MTSSDLSLPSIYSLTRYWRVSKFIVDGLMRPDPPEDGSGRKFLIADLQRCRPGGTVKVACLDGDTELHRRVVAATEAMTDACSLVLDFG